MYSSCCAYGHLAHALQMASIHCETTTTTQRAHTIPYRPHRATPCHTHPTHIAAVLVHRHTPHHTAANMCGAPVHTPEGAVVALSTGTRFQPPGNVHAPYYPLKGPYSSSDPATVRDHIQEMLSCNVTVLVSSSHTHLDVTCQALPCMPWISAPTTSNSPALL